VVATAPTSSPHARSIFNGDIVGFIRPHAEDPDVGVAVWTGSFVAESGDRTIDVLARMPDAFRDTFGYEAKVMEGMLEYCARDQ
jgi:hypothetical protein